MRTAVRYQAELDQLCINIVRFLSVDAVQKAKQRPSGHAARGRPNGLFAVDAAAQAQSAVHLEPKLERLISVVNTLDAGSRIVDLPGIPVEPESRPRKPALRVAPTTKIRLIRSPHGECRPGQVGLLNECGPPQVVLHSRSFQERVNR